MKFYAYIPRKDGSEPLGTEKRLLFQLKTVAGAHSRARRILGPKYRLFTYANFYDNRTFKEV